ILFFLFFFLIIQQIKSQKPYVQVQAAGGYSVPVKPVADAHHFSENGWNINGGFSMYFGKFGIMTRGGYQRFASYPGFQSFVLEKYKEDFKVASGQYWINAFGMIGPAFKWSLGNRLDL